MPFYVDDFEADTAHLSLEEDGVYNRLLRLCWRTPDCSVPDDRSWIMRRMRVDEDTYRRVVEPIIQEYFTRDQGRIWQKRQRQEYAFVSDLVRKRKEAGSRGGKASALKRKEIDPSKATALPPASGESAGSKNEESTARTTSTPTSKKEREANASQKKGGSRLPADWILPKNWGHWAITQGLKEETVRRESERFRDYWYSVAGAKGVKCDWEATWRNWVRQAIDFDRKSPFPVSQPRPGEERILPNGRKQRFRGGIEGWIDICP